MLGGERAQRQEPHAGHAALVVDLVVRESLGVFLRSTTRGTRTIETRGQRNRRGGEEEVKKKEPKW